MIKYIYTNYSRKCKNQ